MTKWEPYLIGIDHNPKFVFGCIWYIVHNERFGWLPLKDFDNAIRMDSWNWKKSNLSAWYNGLHAARWLDKMCKGSWSSCYSVEDRSKIRMFFELESDMISFQGIWVHLTALTIKYKQDEEAEQWCIENCSSYMFYDGRLYYFSDANDVMRFKLTWV
jgi:hypothetical protein